MWDLRNPTYPFKEWGQESHSKGIVAASWNHMDANLLMSSARPAHRSTTATTVLPSGLEAVCVERRNWTLRQERKERWTVIPSTRGGRSNPRAGSVPQAGWMARSSRCGKDNRTICWNFSTGTPEIFSEVQSQAWNLEARALPVEDRACARSSYGPRNTRLDFHGCLKHHCTLRVVLLNF